MNSMWIRLFSKRGMNVSYPLQITYPIRRAKAVTAKHPKTTIKETTSSLLCVLRPGMEKEQCKNNDLVYQADYFIIIC